MVVLTTVNGRVPDQIVIESPSVGPISCCVQDPVVAFVTDAIAPVEMSTVPTHALDRSVVVNQHPSLGSVIRVSVTATEPNAPGAETFVTFVTADGS